jgi:hypothetical protein
MTEQRKDGDEFRSPCECCAGSDIQLSPRLKRVKSKQTALLQTHFFPFSEQLLLHNAQT